MAHYLVRYGRGGKLDDFSPTKSIIKREGIIGKEIGYAIERSIFGTDIYINTDNVLAGLFIKIVSDKEYTYDRAQEAEAILQAELEKLYIKQIKINNRIEHLEAESTQGRIIDRHKAKIELAEYRASDHISKISEEILRAKAAAKKAQKATAAALDALNKSSEVDCDNTQELFLCLEDTNKLVCDLLTLEEDADITYAFTLFLY